MNIKYDEHKRYSQVPRRHDDRMSVLWQKRNATAGSELEVVQEHLIVLLHLEHHTLETSIKAVATGMMVGTECE